MGVVVTLNSVHNDSDDQPACVVCYLRFKFYFHSMICPSGVNFDFFGIGEYWGCRSKYNDFGLQFRLFYFERASLIGGVALKAGVSVITVMTIKTIRARDSPIVRFAE